ncbi:insulinase family protein, partial [Burkholderia sp. SIMBA_013]
AHPSEGTPESVPKITLAQLQAFHAKAYAAGNAVIAVVGDLTRAEAEAELRDKGIPEDEVQKLAPHKVIPGNRPSNTIVVERISPRRLGALVAMYE